MAVNEHITISKNLVLPDGQDYYKLREQGIGLIQQLGSKLWTDYNIHDPGITILEVLCYAITDITYRSSFDVKDLIAVEKPGVVNTDEQTFFTAREILTTAPWTIKDYRKALIDLDGIKNAWLKCSLCNCGPKIYVDCKSSELTYTPPSPPEKPEDHEVIPKGLYDVLVEFDADNRFGDLNSGRISTSSHVLVDMKQETLFFDIFFPSLGVFSETYPALLPYFIDESIIVKKVTVYGLADKYGNLLTDDSKLKKALRKGVKASFKISLSNGADAVITDVPFKLVWLKDEVRGALTIADIIGVLSDKSKSGIAARYINKIRTVYNILGTAKKYLQRHRNITEDFCCIDEVEVKEVGVCLDIDLKPEADIEEVLANAYYLIGEYFNPTIKFRTLAEMLEPAEGEATGRTVDQIFDGPKLSHGFIDENDLDRTELNRTLYSSDIINLLMDIPGVLAVRNFVLVDFDEYGDIKSSDPWQMDVPANMLPRLYIAGSKMLAFKNGLPFLPDVYELMDTLQMIAGSNNSPKLKDTDLDIPVPDGNYYPLAEYFPVQNSMPLVYGTGYEGLPSNASDLRQVQAKQLKAYLLFYEQVLVNYIGQLSNLKNLLSISNTVSKTYFPVLLGSDIAGINDLYDSLDEMSLYEITESKEQYADRRNRFLDHLLSRFSESFSEYALLLYSYSNQAALSSDKLIKTKTSFLKQFPYQSAYKAQSFDYTNTVDVDIYKDQSGLHHRISALLGLRPSLNYFNYDIVKADDQFSTTLTLCDDNGNIFLTAQSPDSFKNDDRDELIKEINFSMAEILKLVNNSANYTVKADGVKYKIELGTPSVAYATGFDTISEANDAISAIVDFAGAHLNDEHFLIVEHILLRPRAVNDALLDICVEDNCKFCGEEDPYSYSVTFVFNGEADYATAEFRRFANNTIRAELPAHVLCKICWVKADVYASFETAYINWLKDIYINPPVDDLCKTKGGVTANPLKNLVCEFKQLKSVYWPATLHDCIDGNDDNPVFLNQTNL